MSKLFNQLQATYGGRSSPRRRVLAVASAGGHWIQLLRLMPAFGRHDVTFVSTRPWCQQDCGRSRFYCVADASRWDRLRLVVSALQVVWVLLRVRPHVIVSTGALPGFIAVRLGRLLGARTVWVDSMANAETPSLSGRAIGRHTSLWLTQWPHLAGHTPGQVAGGFGGPRFEGRVL